MGRDKTALQSGGYATAKLTLRKNDMEIAKELVLAADAVTDVFISYYTWK